MEDVGTTFFLSLPDAAARTPQEENTAAEADLGGQELGFAIWPLSTR
jgi:hypothetical protein